MNNREIQTEQQEQMPTMAIGQQADTVASSRRRLLRAGLKAAPVVVATLAARPSLACHCVLPSAWGSINAALGGGDTDMGNTQQVVGKLTGSMQRYANSIIDFSQNNPLNFGNFNSIGWSALKAKYPSFPSDVDTNRKKIAYLKGNFSSPSKGFLTVDGLCAAIGYTTPTGAGAAKPYDLIMTTRGFGASVLIAQINLFIGRVPPECLKNNNMSAKQVINKLASGSFTVPDTNEFWDQSQIADYLHNNWLARR
jgi:hypothetical protein